MTRSGAIPYSPSRRVSAVSTVITAGCWISVRRSSSSARAIASASSGSANTMSDRRRPSSSGAMIASASSKRSATTGSRRRSSASMFAYWEPWPVYRNATLPGPPLPRWMPRARSAGHAGGVARLQHPQRQLRLRHEVGAVGVIDRDPLGRAQRVAAGRCRVEVAPLPRLRQLGPQRVGEPRLVRRAQHERTAQRRLRRRRRGELRARRRRHRCRRSSRLVGGGGLDRHRRRGAVAVGGVAVGRCTPP